MIVKHSLKLDSLNWLVVVPLQVKEREIWEVTESYLMVHLHTLYWLLPFQTNELAIL